MYRPNTPPRVDVDVFSSTPFDFVEMINSEVNSSLILGDINNYLLKYGTNDGILARVILPFIHKLT